MLIRNQAGQVVEQYMILMAGVFKLATVSAEVYEGFAMHAANQQQQDQPGEGGNIQQQLGGRLFGGVKLISSVLSVACMVVSNVKGIQNASLAQRIGDPDPTMIPNTVSRPHGTPNMSPTKPNRLKSLAFALDLSDAVLVACLMQLAA